MPSIKQEPSSSWEYGPFVWEGEDSIEMQMEEYPTTDFQAVADLEPSLGANASHFIDAWVDPMCSPKLQIRNHDCMWSGTCGDLSHPNKGLCGGADHGTDADSHHSHGPLCGGNKFSTVTAEAAASLNSKAAQKPILTSNGLNISNNNSNNSGISLVPKIPKVQAAQIPAGRSLLINPRNKQQQTSRIPTVSTEDFLRERDGAVAALHTRPDTPLSLDDDPPVLFKHNKIDLATCTIGSNRLSLTGGSRYCSNYSRNYDDASSHRIINLLKEQLEDMENGNMRSCLSSCSDVGSLTDLLQDLKEMNGDDAADSLGEDADSDSDSLSGEDHQEGITSSSRSGCSKGGGGGGISGGYTHAHHGQGMSPLSSSSSSPSSSSSSSSSASSSYEYQGTHVGDHSYTRPKNRYNLTDLGVQTPSDSEEEIDVVSIGEKNLPTNPTARDRRALQSHVAHKIARKTHPDGSQHHPRRRHSDDDEYCSKTPSAHHHPAHHHRSGSSHNSNNNSNNDHHHHHLSGSSSHNSPSKLGGAGGSRGTSTYSAFSPNYLTPASSTSISGTNTPLPGGSSSSGSSSSGSSNPRKRPSSKDERGSGSSSKNRHHGHARKKQRIPGKKPASDSCEEQETLEKRNLHNDMERQRRIGLKNLFEELKRQIPTLREKERAPKVNILREAAILCTRLNREQEQLKALHKQQERLLARVRQLRSSLHTQRRVMD